MAVLALAGAGSAIGASIGGTFLGMSASSIGWMAGSFLGQLLFAEKTHTYGPRLKGDRFAGSALGQVRPIVWGTCKVEGKIIWQTPYHEHEHTEDSGGKGGGSEYTSYTYTRSFAVLLCEGQIEAVRKVWINGKLEFDWSENSNVAADMQSGTKVGDIKFYYGSSTQLPDPTMESFDGVGNIPAYRGSAYMVFNEYDVTESSGACPIVEVEVVANASLATQKALGGFIYGDTENWGQIGYVNEGVLYYLTESFSEYTDPFKILGVDLSNGNVVFSQSFAHVMTSGYQRGPFSDDQYYYYFMGTAYIDSATAESATISQYYKMEGGDTVAVGSTKLRNNDGTSTIIAAYGGWKDQGTLEKFIFKRGVYQTYLYATSVDQNSDQKRWVQRWDMPNPTAEKRYDFSDGTYSLKCYPSEDGDVYVFNASTQKVYRFDLDLNLIDDVDVPANESGADLIAYADGLLWFASGLNEISSTDARVAAYDITDMSLAGAVTDISYGVSTRTNGRAFSMYASGQSVALTIDDRIYTVQTRRVTRQSATLSDIVANLHQRAGQTSDDYDVSALTDSVRGFLVTEQISVRSCIESLQLGFLFDARDTGGKIQYVKRGGASLATLIDDDLGAYENEPVSEWTLTRQQEEELPKTLTINYLDYNGSYENSAQNATRQAVLAGDITTFQVPIVFTANEAQEVVSKHLYEAWQARTKYKFTTNMEWAKLEPCDPITVRGKQIRLTQRNDGINGIVEFDGVGYIPEIYTQVGVGLDSSGYEEETLSARGPTVFEIMDTPPLRDADYNYYLEYIAASGVLPDWPSAAIMRSDNGQNYSPIALVDTASVMGNATTVLGDWDGGNVVDESNTVTVQLFGEGTLSSVTFDEAIDGEFPFILGNEIIFGRVATLVSTGIYTISGLLRGRIGTEAYISTHAVNDRFVLLSATTLRRFAPRDADLNVVRYFKGVTSQNKISSATPKAHTYTGRNIKPLSPVQVGGGNTGLESAWTIKWMRRSRYRWQWLDSVDVGDDESTFNFEVRIYDPDDTSAVVRTITVTGATVGADGFFSTSYSNADQITDFGTHRRRIAVSLRQVGSFGNSDWSDITELNSGYASQSVALLHMDGSNGSTTFTDVYGHVFTAQGGAQISTAQFATLTGNTASAVFDGTGDWINTPSSTDWDVAGGEFTIEFFVRRAAAAPAEGFGLVSISSGYTAAYGAFHITLDSSNRLRLLCSSAGTTWNLNINDSSALSINTWYHVACVRFGDSFKIYKDGVSVASGTLSGNLYNSGQPLTIAAQGAAGEYPLNGYLDEFRFTRGAMYTGNFTPPTAPFTT